MIDTIFVAALSAKQCELWKHNHPEFSAVPKIIYLGAHYYLDGHLKKKAAGWDGRHAVVAVAPPLEKNQFLFANQYSGLIEVLNYIFLKSGGIKIDWLDDIDSETGEQETLFEEKTPKKKAFNSKGGYLSGYNFKDDKSGAYGLLQWLPSSAVSSSTISTNGSNFDATISTNGSNFDATMPAEWIMADHKSGQWVFNTPDVSFAPKYAWDSPDAEPAKALIDAQKALAQAQYKMDAELVTYKAQLENVSEKLADMAPPAATAGIPQLHELLKKFGGDMEEEQKKAKTAELAEVVQQSQEYAKKKVGHWSPNPANFKYPKFK